MKKKESNIKGNVNTINTSNISCNNCISKKGSNINRLGNINSLDLKYDLAPKCELVLY